MLKICDESIYKPLRIIFRSCLENGKFPSEWKKANVVPVFKTSNKQELKNYRPISLLPVSSKIFERLLYDSMFKFFTENNLILLNQSGFKPGDSCVSQLLSITHQIFKSLDNVHEVRSVSLDMSKAFDKVWHKGLIFKLKRNGISVNLLSTLTDFLTLRKQRVVLYRIYINDLSECLTTNAKLFAEDVSQFSVVDNINLSATNLNREINAWANQWKMTFNPDANKQAKEVIFSRKIRKTSHPPLTFNNNSVKRVQFQKHLGVYLDSRLDFREHLQNMFIKINKTINLLRKLQNNLPRAPLITIYKSFIRLDYLWLLCTHLKKLIYLNKLKLLKNHMIQKHMHISHYCQHLKVSVIISTNPKFSFWRYKTLTIKFQKMTFYDN